MMPVAKVTFDGDDSMVEIQRFYRVDELKKSLDDHLAKLEKTRVIRLPKREGLIRTRLAGAREAKGEILIFFDSHIEVNINWLPPLIEPIALNYKTSVCPFIDIIKWENFAYIAQDEGTDLSLTDLTSLHGTSLRCSWCI